MKIRQLFYTQPDFPDELRQIASPPKQLFYLGNPALLGPKHPLRVAIVGSRRQTNYGKQVTYQLASELARAGIVIVSGLALGVDSTAHRAALEAGGATIAVQASGLDSITPPSHRDLAVAMLRAGNLIISEYPEGTAAFKQHFVARNRLIAGLAQAVLIPEADARSGSLYTANFALEQNKLVLAVPGNITSPRSSGPNNLLRGGATPITSSEDVLNTLGYSYTEQASAPVRADSPEELAILELLRSGVTRTEQLIEQSSLSASQFANLISLMEITGKVKNLGAGTWIAR